MMFRHDADTRSAVWVRSAARTTVLLALALISACAKHASAGKTTSDAEPAASAEVRTKERTAASDVATDEPAPCPVDSGWNDPSPPRHLYGDTWYVGTCGITALLIRGDAGHILIDSGTEKAAPLVLDNLRALGIDPRDVRILLSTHEHHDHIGGLAALQAATGAPVLARAPAFAVLARGKSDRSDPQFLELQGFPPVSTLREVADGEVVRLGRLALTAHATPGHTAGGTSWTWRSCDAAGACLNMAYVDSLSALSDDEYRYSDEAAHPGVIAAFRRTLDRVAALPCDVLVTPHPGASDLWNRVGNAASAPLRDADACRRYAADARERLDARLRKEAETR